MDVTVCPPTGQMRVSASEGTRVLAVMVRTPSLFFSAPIYISRRQAALTGAGAARAPGTY